MRILKNRRLHVNMGNYEHVEVTATVEIDTEVDRDLCARYDVDTNVLDEVLVFIDMQLDQSLELDVEGAFYGTSEEESFIHEYYEHNYRSK